MSEEDLIKKVVLYEVGGVSYDTYDEAVEAGKKQQFYEAFNWGLQLLHLDNTDNGYHLNDTGELVSYQYIEPDWAGHHLEGQNRTRVHNLDNWKYTEPGRQIISRMKRILEELSETNVSFPWGGLEDINNRIAEVRSRAQKTLRLFEHNNI